MTRAAGERMFFIKRRIVLKGIRISDVVSAKCEIVDLAVLALALRRKWSALYLPWKLSFV